MAYRLPPRPNLKHFRNQAKALVRAHRKGKLAAAERIKAHLPRLAHSIPKEILASASERIRASLDDRICVLYPRSVIEPILASIR